MKPSRTLSIGMLGCGVVGSNVARLLSEDSGDFAARSEIGRAHV